jgi:hypothetical protein
MCKWYNHQNMIKSEDNQYKILIDIIHLCICSIDKYHIPQAIRNENYCWLKRLKSTLWI